MQRSDPRYQAALEHLFDRINYEKSTDRPYNKNHFKLDRMAYLLELLGTPNSRLRSSTSPVPREKALYLGYSQKRSGEAGCERAFSLRRIFLI